MREKLIAIIKNYGAYPQISKAVEELIELAEVLIKDINKSELNTNELYEEIADVEIMLAQLKIIYNINDEILKNYKMRKVERTMDRMKRTYFNEDDKPVYQPDCAWE